MKVFAAGISTETNTFASVPTAHEDFLVQRGNDALAGRVAHPSLNLAEIWGNPAIARGDAFVFSLMAWAQPSGITVRCAYESLRDEILADLRAVMPVDIVLLNLHGAMVAHGYDDCEEDMIRCVRGIVGLDAVIGVELDLHCNLSELTIAAADIVITYKEYPHTDVRERARELFDLAVAAKLGKIRPTMALFDCRMVGLYPTTREPLRGFVDAMTKAELREGVLSVSFGHGFPFADVSNVGAKMLVVTDNDHGLAQQVAREFGMQVYALRREIGFDSISLPMDEALSMALASKTPPVIVADQTDNVGCGAPGDSTSALRWLVSHNVENAAIAIVYDPEVVRIAKKAGLGATVAVRLGGKLGPSSGDPVDMEATVLAMLDRYVHAFPQQSGGDWLFPLGNVVALRYRSIDIVVSSERCQCFSPSVFVDLGIALRQKHLVIVKSAQHFYGAFAPIAGEVIYMMAPGAGTPDPRLVPFRRLNTNSLYPWDQDPLPRFLEELG